MPKYLRHTRNSTQTGSTSTDNDSIFSFSCHRRWARWMERGLCAPTSTADKTLCFPPAWGRNGGFLLWSKQVCLFHLFQYVDSCERRLYLSFVYIRDSQKRGRECIRQCSSYGIDIKKSITAFFNEAEQILTFFAWLFFGGTKTILYFPNFRRFEETFCDSKKLSAILVICVICVRVVRFA